MTMSDALDIRNKHDNPVCLSIGSFVFLHFVEGTLGFMREAGRGKVCM